MKEKREGLMKNLFFFFLGRIDSYEFFSVILFMVSGEFDIKINSNDWCLLILLEWKMIFFLMMKDMAEIFCVEKPGFIRNDEFYYFLDSFFRGLFKILIKKGQKSPSGEHRRWNLFKKTGFSNKKKIIYSFGFWRELKTFFNFFLFRVDVLDIKRIVHTIFGDSVWLSKEELTK